MIDDDEDDRGFFARNWVPLFVVAVLGIGGFALWKMMSGKPKSVARTESITMIDIIPPPPPRPTPVPTPPPPREEVPPPEDQPQMIEQEPVVKTEKAPAPEPDASDEPPSEVLGTGVVGEGPGDGFGLGRSGGGFGGRGGGGGGGSKYGAYAGMVQTRIAEALRRNPRTKSAALRIEVRVWPDATGRITRASLANSTGDAALDAAIRDEILTGLRLAEPPPADMPTPIVLRLTAKRPN